MSEGGKKLYQPFFSNAVLLLKGEKIKKFIPIYDITGKP
jgi:hypothetical protein